MSGTIAAAPRAAGINLSWPVIIGLLGLMLPLLAPSATMIDPDTFMHIAAGQWMLEHGALPSRDPFSGTLPGAAWVQQQWLSELVLAIVYRLAGWGGLVLLTTACFGLALALLARRLLVHAEPFTVLIMVLLTGGIETQHLLIRPHMLGLPILVTWAGMLIAARDAEKPPPFLALPLMILWPNLHGAFVYGLGLAFFFAAEAVLCAGDPPSRRLVLRQWGLFAGLAVLAAMLTPSGPAGVLNPFRVVALPTNAATFVEWLPPDLRQDHALVTWILGAMALAFGLGLKLPPMRLILLLGLFYETFQSARHVEILCLVAPLAVAAALGPQLAARIRGGEASALARWMDRRAQPSSWPGLSFAALLVAALGTGTALHPPQPIDPAVYPVAAIAAARDRHLTGQVLNEERFGGYLMYAGIPTFIDGRSDMFGDAFLARWAQAALGNRPVLTALLDQYHVGWTLFPPEQGAVPVLDTMPGWRRAYGDGTAVIHVRTDSAVPVGPAEDARGDRPQ